METYNKYLVRAAQVISLIFHPWYIPLVGIILLLNFTYLSNLPKSMHLILIGIVYFFTILLPHITVKIYRQVNGWTSHEISQRERRLVPYVLSIICYGALLYVMRAFNAPPTIIFVIMIALAIQIICAVINHWYKISTHAAASGALVGILMAFSLMIGVYMLGWICVAILLCGMVCTARIILRQHTLMELGLGTTVGVLSGWMCSLLMFSNV